MSRKNGDIPPDEKWEKECKLRIHKLLCSIHIEKPTLSRAQEIMEGYADADMLLQRLMEVKSVMVVNGNKHDFTGQGLAEYFSSLLEQAKEKHGPRITELQLATFAIRHSREILNDR